MDLDLERLLQHAIAAAEAAAAVIRSYCEQDVDVAHKSTGDSEASQVVTEVDHAAQRVIIETLAPTLSGDGIALLAEESTDDGSRFEQPAFWSIDPMDGTLAFIRKQAGYAVSIALVSSQGDPLLGVVYDPVSRDRYHAVRGGGAFLNDQPLESPPLDKSAPLVLCADISFARHERLQETREAFDEIAAALGLSGSTIDLRIGAVMNALSALGEPNHCYFKYPRRDDSGGSLWDYAATACIVSEAGGVACDAYGEAMDLNRRGSTFMNHRGVLYAPSDAVAQAIIERMR